MLNIRNVAIIAHVDHGKTTLVDALLKQSETKMHKDTAESLIMDSNELEQERGITIFSKNASVIWKPASTSELASLGEGTKINIIDTPGHADFGGEVERVLKMADGCLLLIDAKEGPMPQTRFVLKKALEMKHKVIVVINKIDKADARVHHVLDKTLELFLDLGADDTAADFPIVYASAKNGLAGLDEDLSKMSGIEPVFETIMKEIPQPSGDVEKPLQILITTLSSDPHKGRIAIGRIYNGKIKNGQEVMQITRDGNQKRARVTALMTFVGLERLDVEESFAGDIIALAGIENPSIGETITDVDAPTPLPQLNIEEPTIRVNFMVNNSPFGGREGEFKTSRQLEERLYKELETDMALRVENNLSGGWTVSGRGELHLAIFMERMRREGYEFQVARPQVIDKIIDGKTLTPFEKVYIEVPKDSSGVVIQKMGERRAELIDMKHENGIAFLEFVISTKALFGYRSEFIENTRGLGIFNTLFFEYRQDSGFEFRRQQGSIVAFETGVTNGYALTSAQDRGQLFVSAAAQVYKGQVVGQNSRAEDIFVNVCKTKNLTNMRSKGEGVGVHVKEARKMDLEDALEYISADELVEITPQNIRIRKVVLDETEARRIKSQAKDKLLSA